MADLNGFKVKARQVMDTFNVNPRAFSQSHRSSFLEKHVIHLSVSNFGAAVLLNAEIDNYEGSPQSQPGKAFLLAMESLNFKTHREETGQATLKNLSCQFVPQYAVGPHF